MTPPPRCIQAIPLVDVGAQHRSIEADVVGAMQSVLASNDWILGEDVAAFEHEFATYCGVGGAVGTDSGTSALELALRACGVGAGDEVITAANTFIATALAISHAGARPVLVDVDPVRHTIDPSRIEAAITARTRAIVPVHLYGCPADMDAIDEIAEVHGLTVVEDACQAHGARYRGRRCGSLGHAAAFSFYPAKNLGAYGDGGVVVSDDDAILASVRRLRNYGQTEKYVHEEKGFNRRLDTLQAAALRVKLRHLDDWNDARRALAARYSAGLQDLGLVPAPVAVQIEPVWHLYVIELDRRDALRSYLAGLGIETGIHYPVPIHLQPAYSDLGYAPGSFPIAEHAASRVVSLPMFPELSPSSVDTVAAAVCEFITEGAASTAA